MSTHPTSPHITLLSSLTGSYCTNPSVCNLVSRDAQIRNVCAFAARRVSPLLVAATGCGRLAR
jgi:hypothetical protein